MRVSLSASSEMAASSSMRRTISAGRRISERYQHPSRSSFPSRGPQPVRETVIDTSSVPARSSEAQVHLAGLSVTTEPRGHSPLEQPPGNGLRLLNYLAYNLTILPII